MCNDSLHIARGAERLVTYIVLQVFVIAAIYFLVSRVSPDVRAATNLAETSSNVSSSEDDVAAVSLAAAGCEAVSISSLQLPVAAHIYHVHDYPLTGTIAMCIIIT